MQMMNAYKQYWSHYVDFNGTTDRAGYWWTVLCNLIVIVIIMALSSAIPQLSFSSIIFGLVSIIPSIAIKIRRYRDAGVSPWFVIIGELFWPVNLVVCVLPSRY